VGAIRVQLGPTLSGTRAPPRATPKVWQPAGPVCTITRNKLQDYLHLLPSCLAQSAAPKLSWTLTSIRSLTAATSLPRPLGGDTATWGRAEDWGRRARVRRGHEAARRAPVWRRGANYLIIMANQSSDAAELGRRPLARDANPIGSSNSMENWAHLGAVRALLKATVCYN